MGGVSGDDAPGRANGLLLELSRRDTGLHRPRPSPRGLLQCGVDPRDAGSQGGCSDLPYLMGLVQREFPGVAIVSIPFNHATITDFFEGRGPSVDALAYTAERGSFRSLLYPAFSVAVPHPVVLKLPLAYPVARHDVEAARFLSNWIDLKQKDGTIPALYDHWVLGRDARPPRPRWSVLRNVLHWVN